MIINRETFIPSTEPGSNKGTVEVTLRGITRRVEASLIGDLIFAGGMYGRYRTSPKHWPAHVTSRPMPDGSIRESAFFGRDDRSGRFNKTNAIYFA